MAPSNAPTGALVRTAPKEVFKDSYKGTKRDANGQLPTTSRALVLRNGKHGSQGTGEVVLVKMTGREKLDLLAEDLTRRKQTALMRKFNLEECLRIAESQRDIFLDDISCLKDHELFYSTITNELRSRTARGQEIDRSPSNVANVIATRIHNSFLLASAWQLVFKYLKDLQTDGFNDAVPEKQLKENEVHRYRYVVAFELVSQLANLGQARVASLAMITPHYASYFKQVDKTDQMVFDWERLKEAGRSFIDSIILELCFPRAPYSQAVLYSILHDAIDENPREAKRFPQALFDAVGDLAVVVQLQEMLDQPLQSAEAQEWKSQKLEMPEDYKTWEAAQGISEEATNNYPTFKNIIFPLEKTEKPDVLGNMWKLIDLNYQKVGQADIETIWQLSSAFTERSSWSATYIKPAHADRSANYDSDDEGASGPPRLASGNTGGQKRLALTDGKNDIESDGSMPDLQSVSNSSEEDSDYESDSDSDQTDEGESDSSSEYDELFEEELGAWRREAMGIINDMNQFESIDPMGHDSNENPFLKLLGSLRGRMFSSNSKLKTGKRAPDAAKPVFTEPSGRPKPPPSGAGGVIVEEAEDEEDVSAAAKKKKKKKKKTKKKSAAPAEPETPVVPPSEPKLQTSPKPSSTKKAGVGTSLYNLPPFMSSTSLSQTTTAQSGRSYIQSEKLDDAKEKIKTRAGHASLFSMFGRKEKSEKSKAELDGETKNKRSWFGAVSKRAKDGLEQLFHLDGDSKVKPMKWDTFVKVMTEMGFTPDFSTAGSSVRFDPPNPKDPPITVHKPHPDTVYQPVQVMDIGRRLKKHYGWSKEDLEALKLGKVK